MVLGYSPKKGNPIFQEYNLKLMVYYWYQMLVMREGATNIFDFLGQIVRANITMTADCAELCLGVHGATTLPHDQASPKGDPLLALGLV